MVSESLEADIIWNMDPQELLQGAIKKRQEWDFLNAALAEILFALSDTARDIKNSEVAKSWWAFAMASLEEIATSPTAGPMLDYEEIFWELSQKSREEWTYNIIAISFDRYGLARLGSQAIQRGLQLIAIEGDKEGLRSQLRDS